MGRSNWSRILVGIALLSCYGCPPDWSESFDYDGQEPFDTYMLYELLAARPEGVVRVKDTLSALDDEFPDGANYLFVGHYPYFRESTVTRLLAFVERGNRALLLSPGLPEDLGYHLFGDACYYEAFIDLPSYYNDPRFPVTYRDSITAYLEDGARAFPLTNVRYWHPFMTPHVSLSDQLFCDELLDIEPLGTVDTLGVNFLRVGWGEGEFYLHTNPLYFTNYFLDDSLSYTYAEACLAALGPGPVLYDDYHGEPTTPGSQSANAPPTRNYNGGRNLLSGNPALRYILEQPPLALAWYTILAGGLLFVIFRGRRRQRIIPVLPSRENTSRQFIETISRLVYLRGNHLALARREVSSLRFDLQRRFGLRWPEGEDPPPDLAERTGVPPAVAQRAAREIRLVSRARTFGEGDLLRFYRAIRPLYGRNKSAE